MNRLMITLCSSVMIDGDEQSSGSEIVVFLIFYVNIQLTVACEFCAK